MHAWIPSATLFSLIFSMACSGDPGTVEAVYEACATDENWRTFDDYETTGRVKSDASVTPQWIAPSMSAAFSAAASPIWQWQPSATLTGMLDGDATCPQFQPSSLGSGRLQPKHLPPVSGTVYDLHFALDGADAYRLITTRQRAGVPANVFSGWAGKSVTVTIYEAKMLMNEIMNGPAQAPTLTIQITP